MMRRHALLLLVFLAPALARADDASPEHLLPATTQVFMRWDGLSAHREAYDRTAMGKMMKGDMGKFLDSAVKQLQDGLGGALTVSELLGGVPPAELEKLQKDATQASKLPSLLIDQGFLLGIEVRSALPPSAQVTIIVPNGAARSAPLTSAIRLIAGLNKVPIKESKHGKGSLYSIDAEPVYLGWWNEGPHLVLVVGSDKVEVAAKRMSEGTHARLTANPLYKKIAGFKQFQTNARAFLDVAAVAKLARGVHPEAGKIIDQLGLDGLKSITFYSGFEDIAERGLMEVDVSGGRKGLLALATGKSFKLSDVPPLPDDTVSWTMTSFDAAATYDTVLATIETMVKLYDPNELPRIQEGLKVANEILGIDIRKDLLGSLGDQLVQYSSPAEGPFNLGQTFLIKAKDPARLQETLDQALKGVAKSTGVDITVKKRKYRGVELREVHFKQQGFFFLPTYAVHKDWLVVSYYPQPVQGYILRATGELPSWKPDAAVRASLEKLPQEFTSISVSDPRPGVKQLLSLAPMIAQAISSAVPDVKLDVGSIPNGHEVCKHLFPNVSIATDDGKVLRYETRASLSMPFDASGIDTYVLGFALVGLFSAGK